MLIIVFILQSSSTLYCQSLGISLGYGFLSMGEVNKDLDDSKDLFSSAGLVSSSPEEVSGGLFLEANAKYRIGDFNLGITANYLSSSGNFKYSDIYGYFEEKYDVSTS